MYKNVIAEMYKEINLSIERKSNLYKAKNLLLISNLIEYKILSMNNLVKDDNQDVILSKKRLIINNMYSLYLILNKAEHENIVSILGNNGYSLNYSLAELEEAKVMILENIDSSMDRDNKIIYKNLLNIIENNTSKEEKSYA